MQPFLKMRNKLYTWNANDSYARLVSIKRRKLPNSRFMQKLHVETCPIERNTELVTYCSCGSKQEILTVSFIFDQTKPEKKIRFYFR